MRALVLSFSLVLAAAGLPAPSAAAPEAASDPAADPSGADPAEAARLEEEAAARRAEAERLLAAAVAEQREIERLQYALVDAARARGENEREAIAVEGRLADLSVEEQELVAQINADRDAMADVFAALARIERSRPPALLAHGDSVLEAARAAELLSDVAPALDERAQAALGRLRELQGVRVEISDERVALGDAESRLELRRAEIADLIAERTDRLAATRALAELRADESQRLATRAADVRELISELERRSAAFSPRVRPARAPISVEPRPRLKPRPDVIGIAAAPYTPPTGRFADARGTLSLPVEGRIVSRFGQESLDGSTDGPSDGVVIRARREAQVTSPFDARIEYAGPFRTYGQLMILSVGDGYHIVLAGLSSIFGVPEQTVLAGEPVGELSAAGRSAADLYLEIWKDGEPIDPGPWLRINSASR